jgi:aldose sugar dehydrogenase
MQRKNTKSGDETSSLFRNSVYPVLKNNTNHKYENRDEIYATKHGFLSRIMIGTCAFVLISLILSPVIIIQHVAAQPSILKDADLKVESVVSGLSSPTSMVFIDSNNILVLEKDGNVRLVSNGQLHSQPVLHVSVDVTSERGLLGIAVMNTSSSISNNDNDNKIALLYYTESQGGGELRNKVYRYEWNGQSLINPKLILDLPGLPGPNHDGGKLTIGPDGYLYAVIGDLNHRGQVQNIKNGPPPDDTGGIFRMNPNDGSLANKSNPFLTEASLNNYYAYGIRNSFGLGFDPITGNLWDTENGLHSYDEINLVKSGFNSGWIQVMGPISRSGTNEDQLVNFSGSQYADPVFSWLKPVAPTAIEFLKSSKLGPKYTNNIFAGDYITGNLYFFELNKTRTGFNFNIELQPGLSDLVADNKREVSEVTFATGFGGISDIKTGPEGYLYVLSVKDGSLFRILPATTP